MLPHSSGHGRPAGCHPLVGGVYCEALGRARGDAEPRATARASNIVKKRSEGSRTGAERTKLRRTAKEEALTHGDEERDSRGGA